MKKSGKKLIKGQLWVTGQSTCNLTQTHLICGLSKVQFDPHLKKLIFFNPIWLKGMEKWVDSQVETHFDISS